MNEVIFKDSPDLTSEEKRIADLHSLFNILNVLSCELAVVEMTVEGHAQGFTDLEDEVQAIAQELREGSSLLASFDRIRASADKIIDAIVVICASDLPDVMRSDVTESMANLKSIYKIVEVRLKEFEFRAEDSDL